MTNAHNVRSLDRRTHLRTSSTTGRGFPPRASSASGSLLSAALPTPSAPSPAIAAASVTEGHWGLPRVFCNWAFTLFHLASNTAVLRGLNLRPLCGDGSSLRMWDTCGLCLPSVSPVHVDAHSPSDRTGRTQPGPGGVGAQGELAEPAGEQVA